MRLSDDFLQQIEDQLQEWRAELDEIQAQMDQADADLEFDYATEIRELRQQHENLVTVFEDLKGARSTEEREDLKNAFDELWGRFKESFDSEAAKFKKEM